MTSGKRSIKYDSENVPFVKIVVYGPAQSGKTNLLKIYSMLKTLVSPSEVISQVTKIQNPARETAFFDQTVFGVGKKSVTDPETGEDKIVPIVKYGIYTVAGENKYKETREIVLKGVNGIILVLDAQKGRLEDNRESIRELLEIVGEERVKSTPILVIANKYDLEGAKLERDDFFKLFSEFQLSASLEEFSSMYYQISLLEARNLMLGLQKSDRNVLTPEGLLRREVLDKQLISIIEMIQKVTSSTIKQIIT